jgi:hypothetical protein
VAERRSRRDRQEAGEGRKPVRRGRPSGGAQLGGCGLWAPRDDYGGRPQDQNDEIARFPRIHGPKPWDSTGIGPQFGCFGRSRPRDVSQESMLAAVSYWRARRSRSSRSSPGRRNWARSRKAAASRIRRSLSAKIDDGLRFIGAGFLKWICCHNRNGRAVVQLSSRQLAAQRAKGAVARAGFRSASRRVPGIEWRPPSHDHYCCFGCRCIGSCV